MPFLDPDDFLPTGLDIRTLLVHRPSATFFMRTKGDALADQPPQKSHSPVCAAAIPNRVIVPLVNALDRTGVTN